MALWTDCGGGLVRASFARRDLGLDALLCCPGPSLAEVDDARLHVPGAMVVAVNTAYPAVRPDLWVGMDVPACYDRTLFWQPFPKILRGAYRDETVDGLPVRRCPAVYFADVERAHLGEMFLRRGHDVKFVFQYNTFMTALHLLVWMGARTIRLVGCDFGGRGDYHDGRALPPAQRASNRRLYGKLVAQLRALSELASACGVQISSSTPGSPVNDFLPYVPLAEALRRAAGRVPPDRGLRRLHSAEADLCMWRGAVADNAGVMVGADRRQEWLLPWWHEAFRRHNPDLPVAFADFGLSPEMLAWCRRRGRVVAAAPPPSGLAWHAKPFAMLRTPFLLTAWLDADCEVRGELSPLLKAAEAGFAVTRETCRRVGWAAEPVATGVVAFRRGNPLVREWARAVLAGRFRGDQEALNAIADARHPGVTVLPGRFQRLRLEGDLDPDALVMHWTGPAGKALVRGREARRAAGETRPARGEG